MGKGGEGSDMWEQLQVIKELENDSQTSWSMHMKAGTDNRCSNGPCKTQAIVGILCRVDHRGIAAVHITSWYPKFNGSHFRLPPSSIHKMTGLGGYFVIY